jgi:hypothetical protein
MSASWNSRCEGKDEDAASQGSTGGFQMQAVRMIYWEQDGAWLGYIAEYPGYWTQGARLDDLKKHLRICILTSREVSFPAFAGPTS